MATSTPRPGGSPQAPQQLPFAPQPDIVLAQEKDQVHMRELRDQVYMVAEGALGPQTTTGAKPELVLLADLLYLGLTMAKGRQTLGEEYSDLFLVLPDGRSRLPRWRARALALTLAIGPYIVTRLSSGGWASLWSAMRRETARERAAALARRAHQQRLNNEQSSTSFWSQLNIANNLLWILPVCAQIHLALFYWAGDYIEPAKRLWKGRYAFTREPATKRPTYKALSAFIAIQLALQFGVFLVDKFGRSADGGSNDGSEHGNDLVPSLSASSAEENMHRYQGLMSSLCGICLSPMKTPACPPCGHVYCYECIVESSLAKSECPLCRREASPQSVQCIYV